MSFWQRYAIKNTTKLTVRLKKKSNKKKVKYNKNIAIKHREKKNSLLDDGFMAHVSHVYLYNNHINWNILRCPIFFNLISFTVA